MAFDLAKYNLTPFNVQSAKTVFTKIVGYETVSVSIGTALQVFTHAIGYERVNETVSGELSYPTKAIGREIVSEGVTTGFLTVVSRLDFSENIDAHGEIQADIITSPSGYENVIADTSIVAEITTALNGEESIESDIVLGAIIKTAPEGFELVSETANLEAVDTKTAVLTLTLKPGERLIVDSSSYNVLLNGNNAIDIHSGDWIDELNRDTQSITVSAASGESYLSISMLYTERYL